MTPANKIKLRELLAELYEAGDTPEDIVEVITDDMTSSEQIDLIKDILTGVKDKDKVNEFIEESAVDLMQDKHVKARLLTEYDDSELLKAVSGSDDLEDFIVSELEKDDNLKENVLLCIGGNVQINPKLLTMDKQSRLEDFIQSLFPYYNEQQSIQFNF